MDSYSFLRAQMDRIASTGGDAQTMADCARRFLELQRQAVSPDAKDSVTAFDASICSLSVV